MSVENLAHLFSLPPFLQTEEEINTLRQVLTAKESHAAELRRSLGLTTLSQMKAELAKIQSSQAYAWLYLLFSVQLPYMHGLVCSCGDIIKLRNNS